MSKIKINEYILNDPRIKKDKTILCMSDIHSNIKNITNILDLLKKFKLDYILIPGDIIDMLDKENQDSFLDEIIKLSKYAKTYIVLGNHDVLLDRRKNKLINKNDYDKYLIFNKLKNINNLVLFDKDYETIKLDDNITISGLNIANEYYCNHEKIELFDKYMDTINYKDLNKNNFNILLVHSPNSIIRKKKIIDEYSIIRDSSLILCGHNHGGLTPTWMQDILKNHIGVVGPYNRIIESLAYGTWTNDNKSLIVSNGVTKIADSIGPKTIRNIVNGILIPEIDIIYLKSGNNHKLKLTKRTNYKI